MVAQLSAVEALDRPPHHVGPVPQPPRHPADTKPAQESFAVNLGRELFCLKRHAQGADRVEHAQEGDCNWSLGSWFDPFADLVGETLDCEI